MALDWNNKDRREYERRVKRAMQDLGIYTLAGIPKTWAAARVYTQYRLMGTPLGDILLSCIPENSRILYM